MKSPVCAAAAACAFAAATAIAAGPTLYLPRTVPQVRLMVLGFSVPGIIPYTTAGAAVINGLEADAVSPTVNSVELIEEAEGGSFACGENSPSWGTSGFSGYWVSYNSGSPTAGPLLTAALNDISTRLSTSNSTHPIADPPTGFMISLGGVDAEYYNQLGSQVATQYTTCMEYIFTQLESALGGSGPVPIYFEMTGRYNNNINSTGYGGLDAIRAQELAHLVGYTNVVEVPEYYDYGYFNGGHPDLNFQQSFGARWAAAIAHKQYGATGPYLGPSISACTSSGPIISVTISAESGDTITQPSPPWGFSFFDGSTQLNSTTWIGWAGNTAQWNAGESSVAALHCKYLADWGPNFSPTQVIKGVTSGAPLLQAQF